MARAIRRFRAVLGDTQQGFAKRLGLSVTSVARYEIGWHPSPTVLQKLTEISKTRDLVLFEATFRKALPVAEELDDQELAAVSYLLEWEVQYLRKMPSAIRRARAALALLHAPLTLISAVERIITDELAQVDTSVDDVASVIVKSRSTEAEARYFDYLRDGNPKWAFEYLKTLEENELIYQGAADHFNLIRTTKGDKAAHKFLRSSRLRTDFFLAADELDFPDPA